MSKGNQKDQLNESLSLDWEKIIIAVCGLGACISLNKWFIDQNQNKKTNESLFKKINNLEKKIRDQDFEIQTLKENMSMSEKNHEKAIQELQLRIVDLKQKVKELQSNFNS